MKKIKINKILKEIKRIKIFDWIIILALITSAVFSIFYFKREKIPVFIDVTYAPQEILVTPHPPYFWELMNINQGDIIYNSTGEQIATVENVETYDWGSNRNQVLITLKVYAVYHNASKTYTVNGSPLAVGANLPFMLQDVDFEGIIMNVYEKKSDRYKNYSQRESATVEVMYRDIEPWLAKEIINIEQKDSNGRVLIAVKDVQVTPADWLTITDRGETIWAKHPWRKDVVVTFEIKNNIICHNQNCSFGYNQPLKIGNGFWVNSPDIYIGGGSIRKLNIN